MLGAIAFFWLSIRSESDQMMYTLIALGFIGLAFITNNILRKHENKEKG